ncbi:hypothetical protein CC86DRAFT_366029 [Ophiobolus disseminans]|uniref:Uncharacterized protein n=1 Tax=Ophiobolus disseminans TaxID=1469910 RepID=A0A6A7AHH9_9PLEO|nr:hypothetical protein CC86DRAFT_366029 [Ophiobolus disseminans]
MNASATIRASYIREARMSIALPPPPHPLTDLEPRPARAEKLQDFVLVNHIEYRSKCNSERTTPSIDLDVEKTANTSQSSLDPKPQSSFDWTTNTTSSSFPTRLKKMLTVFPYRDPTYLVAILFLLGSIDLVTNAFFDLLPRTIPSTFFETEETVAVPTTVLIGAILFFVAGVFDTFGALNADVGTLIEDSAGKVTYQPALLGSREFEWVPRSRKFLDLSGNSLAFQAGLLVLLGGVIFMFAGIVDFPDIIPEEDNAFFGLVVFGPQIVHGALFFVANVLLALSGQERWYVLEVWDVDWQGAVLNAVGGFGFMMAGLFLFGGEELRAAVAAMVGSWAFLVGSLLRWYVVMEVW